jgi:hypothetical protein
VLGQRQTLLAAGILVDLAHERLLNTKWRGVLADSLAYGGMAAEGVLGPVA